jgi:hypothetical protein
LLWCAGSTSAAKRREVGGDGTHLGSPQSTPNKKGVAQAAGHRQVRRPVFTQMRRLSGIPMVEPAHLAATPTARSTWRWLAQTVHAYPTWSTALRQAAAQFFFEVDGRRAQPARKGGMAG